MAIKGKGCYQEAISLITPAQLSFYQWDVGVKGGSVVGVLVVDFLELCSTHFSVHISGG